MKFCILASGSKGNATYIETPEAKILIDLGVSLEYLKKELNKIDVHPDDITHVLITHNHSDHTKGLKTFLKHHPTITVVSDSIKAALKIDSVTEVINYEPILTLNDLKVRVFRTSHDTEDSFAFIINYKDKSLVYITDTGYLNVKYFNHLKNKDIYIIESNHDVEMLMTGRYPHYLKNRVVGDRGHLSNDDCAYYLCKLVGPKTKHIILAHLSEENNTPELALKSVKKKLEAEYRKKVIVAKQHEPSKFFEV